jgi:phage repressor protein C with HTH and peptisase S24 domain
MDLKEWIKEARQKMGWTQERLGELLGVTKGNVSGWETGRHEPSSYQLLKISMATGHPLEGGSAPLIAAEATMQPILAWEHEDDLPPGEYVMIPRLEVSLSAGSGNEQVQLNFLDKQPQAFRSDWVRAERLKPSKLACMSASGRSMEPSIFDGDSLVVDTSHADVMDGRVYALWYEGGERVKRLFRIPGGGLRIKSDNPDFETIDLGPDLAGQVRIIGRVVHRSGKGGL